MKKKNILTMAGSDPTGGAGIQRDLKVFGDLGLNGLSVVTAITAQNSTTVKGVTPLPGRLITKQAKALLSEFKIDGIKIGMTGGSTAIRSISRTLKEAGAKVVVLDPVMASSGGTSLLGSTKGEVEEGVKEIKRLLRHVTIVTPNIMEAEVLSGIKIETVKDVERASEIIHNLGCRYVLIKGGHLKGHPTDTLFNGHRFTHFKGERIRAGGKTLHGTGCTLSSAIAALIVKRGFRGHRIEEAIEDARLYLVEKIKENMTS